MRKIVQSIGALGVGAALLLAPAATGSQQASAVTGTVHNWCIGTKKPITVIKSGVRYSVSCDRRFNGEFITSTSYFRVSQFGVNRCYAPGQRVTVQQLNVDAYTVAGC